MSSAVSAHAAVMSHSAYAACTLPAAAISQPLPDHSSAQLAASVPKGSRFDVLEAELHHEHGVRVCSMQDPCTLVHSGQGTAVRATYVLCLAMHSF